MELPLILQITSTALIGIGETILVIKKIIEKVKKHKAKKAQERAELKAQLEEFNRTEAIKEELYKEYLKKKGE